MATKSATSGALLGAGDLLCQTLQAEQRQWDWARAARMTLWGLLVNGPSGHFWYRGLDKAIVANGARGVALKVLADQLIYTPPITWLYFVWQNVLSGADGGSSALHSAATQVWPTLQVNWVYWSVVHVATFSVIPLEYRVAFVAVKNFLWGGYLSWAAECAHINHPKASISV